MIVDKNGIFLTRRDLADCLNISYGSLKQIIIKERNHRSTCRPFPEPDSLYRSGEGGFYHIRRYAEISEWYDRYKETHPRNGGPLKNLDGTPVRR